MTDGVERIHQLVEQWNPEDLLRWAFVTFGGYVEIASGFGPEGVVLIDIAAKVQPEFRVFTLDTDFLFSETYTLMEGIERRYGIKVERLKSALTPDDQEHLHGPALWGRDPDACCNLRKVEPLRKKLSQLRAWVTSIRRDQTPERASALKVQWDAKFHLVKINPLADWTAAKVWRYIHDHDLPYNSLHDRGFPASDAPIALEACSREKMRERDAGPGSTRRSAACTRQRKPVP